jgi:hypothetical protein
MIMKTKAAILLKMFSRIDSPSSHNTQEYRTLAMTSIGNVCIIEQLWLFNASVNSTTLTMGSSTSTTSQTNIKSKHNRSNSQMKTKPEKLASLVKWKWTKRAIHGLPTCWNNINYIHWYNKTISRHHMHDKHQQPSTSLCLGS